MTQKCRSLLPAYNKPVCVQKVIPPYGTRWFDQTNPEMLTKHHICTPETTQMEPAYVQKNTLHKIDENIHLCQP